MSYVAGQKLRSSDLPQLNTCAEFQATANQATLHNTDTTLAYGQTNFASSLVTINSDSPGNSFTLNKAGLWAIFATEGLDISNTTGERFFYMSANSVNFCGSAGPGSAATYFTQNIGCVRPFNSGDVIRVRAYQTSTLTVFRLFSFSSNWGRVNFAWLGG